MRKRISIIFLTVLLLFCFHFSVLADTTCSISEDLQTLTIKDTVYFRFNADGFDMDFDSGSNLPEDFDLTPAQKELIKEIDLTSYDNQTIINADIHYVDGSVLSVCFLANEYAETYDFIINRKATEYIVDFEYPSNNTVTASKTDLFGESVIICEPFLESGDYFLTSIQSDDGIISAIVGAVVIDEGKYYYTDFREIGINNRVDFYSYNTAELPAHEITNEELISALKKAEEKYYEDDFGFLYNDELSVSISKAFATIIFILIPLGVFITFLILGIRSKTNYKKLFLLICSLSGVELLAAIVFLFLIG